MLADVDVDELIVTTPLVLAALTAVLLQFMLGFNTAVMNAPAAVIFPGHSTAQWSIAVAAFAVGGPFGALAGGVIADRFGRRRAILLCAWLFLAGGLLMAAAPGVL